MFNDTLKHAVVCGRRRCIRSKTAGITVAKNVGVRALEPVRVDISVQGLLDVRAVEVDFGSGRRVITSVDDTKLAEWMRACLGDMVDVEAGVNFKNRRVEIVELITGTGFGAVGISQDRERTAWRRELEICVQVGGVVASILTLASGLQEGLIEI